jgi:hypothetical protein
VGIPVMGSKLDHGKTCKGRFKTVQLKRSRVMGEKGSKKDKNKAQKQKQEKMEKKQEQQKAKLPAKKNG